jgi:formylglycine-generating enzyme required for sulfatase activity
MFLMYLSCQDNNEAQYPVEIEMVFVEGGTFTMGSQEGSGNTNERPAHEVTLSGFNIGKYEVTYGQWAAVMGSNNPVAIKNCNHPVVNVSWNDVQQFIKKLKEQTGKDYRLPTEAEWEYAARGGNTNPPNNYTYSGSNIIEDVDWFMNNSNSSTHPVGTKNPNELGIYDMSGNVSEWCGDRYAGYTVSLQVNPTGPSTGHDFVLRGGCYQDGPSGHVRVTNRFFDARYRYDWVGFRIVLQ